MAGHFYSATALKRGCKVRLLARDPAAKQVLFGWGSDRGPSIQFYGRGTGRGAGDRETWEWKLTAEARAELRRNLAQGQERGKERRAAKSLLKKLDSAERRLGSKCKV